MIIGSCIVHSRIPEKRRKQARVTVVNLPCLTCLSWTARIRARSESPQPSLSATSPGDCRCAPSDPSFEKGLRQSRCHLEWRTRGDVPAVSISHLLDEGCAMRLFDVRISVEAAASPTSAVRSPRSLVSPSAFAQPRDRLKTTYVKPRCSADQPH